MKVKKLKKSPKKNFTAFYYHYSFLQVIDVVVNATNARPIRVAWRDAEGSQEVPLGALRRIVARDPPLGLALLRGLHD